MQMPSLKIRYFVDYPAIRNGIDNTIGADIANKINEIMDMSENKTELFEAFFNSLYLAGNTCGITLGSECIIDKPLTKAFENEAGLYFDQQVFIDSDNEIYLTESKCNASDDEVKACIEWIVSRYEVKPAIVRKY